MQEPSSELQQLFPQQKQKQTSDDHAEDCCEFIHIVQQQKQKQNVPSLAITKQIDNDYEESSSSSSNGVSINDKNDDEKKDDNINTDTTPPTTTTTIIEIEEKYGHLPLSEMMLMPTEKLCLRTGEVLATFPTAHEARTSVSKAMSYSTQHDFKRALLGQTKSRPIPHIYHGYFWRLKGSNKTPKDYIKIVQQLQQQQQQQNQKLKQIKEPSPPPPTTTTTRTRQSNRIPKKTEALLRKEEEERQRQERVEKKRRRDEQKRDMIEKAVAAEEEEMLKVSTNRPEREIGGGGRDDGPDITSKKRKIDDDNNNNHAITQQQQQQQKEGGEDNKNSNSSKRCRRAGPLILKGIELKPSNMPSNVVPIYSTNPSTTYKGIHKLADRTNKAWSASISYNSEKLYLGSYKTEIKAACMYGWAHLVLYGEEKTNQVVQIGEEYRIKNGLPLFQFPPSSSSSPTEDKNASITPSHAPAADLHCPSTKNICIPRRKKQESEHIVVNGIELNPHNIPSHVIPIYACQGNNNSKNTYRGIYMHKNFSNISWMAGIRYKGRKIHLGSYETEVTAAKIYAWAHFIIHGNEKTRQAIQKGEEYRKIQGLPLFEFPSSSSLVSSKSPNRTSSAPIKSTTATRLSATPNRVPVVMGIELKPENMPIDIVPIYACRLGDHNTYRGTFFRHNSWQAGIWQNGGRLHLGSYEKEVQAACIYAWAHLIIHGKQKTDDVSRTGEMYRRSQGLPLFRFPRPPLTPSSADRNTKTTLRVPPPHPSKKKLTSTSKPGPNRPPTKNGPIVVKDIELKLENLPKHIIPMYNNSGRGNAIYKGTYFSHSNNGWVASLWLGKGTPQLYLGSYGTERAAACIYAWAYSIMHGEEKACDVRKLGEQYRRKRGLPLFEFPSGSEVQTTVPSLSRGEVVVENVTIRLINNGSISPALDDDYPISRSKDALISSRKDEKLHRVFFENDDLKLITKFPCEAMADFKAGKKALRFIVGNNFASWDHNKLAKYTFQDLLEVAGWKRGQTIECQISMVDVQDSSDDDLQEFWI